MLGEYLKRKNKNRNQLVAWLASMNVLQPPAGYSKGKN